MQDPSYDPYGFAKTATFAASSAGGSAPACATNVQNFFQTILALAGNSTGLDDINTNMDLCPDSQVNSLDDVNSTLAKYVMTQWISAVSAATDNNVAITAPDHPEKWQTCLDKPFCWA